MTVKLSCELTKKNLPALWEQGGGYTNTGVATVICGAQGEPLCPVYIRRRGHRACSAHALFIVRPGYHIIQASHHREDFTIEVLSVVNVDTSSQEVTCELVTKYLEGEWSKPLPDYLTAAVKAAVRKALCYHCREPHYFNPGERWSPQDSCWVAKEEPPNWVSKVYRELGLK